MKKLKYYLLYTLTFPVVFMAGCSLVHEYPEEPAVYPYMVDVSLTLDIDMNYDKPDIIKTYAPLLEGDYDIRYTVEIYKAKSNPNADLTECVARFVHTSDEVTTEGTMKIVENMYLPPVDYVILAWVDFVNKSSSEDLYYNTEKLTHISILRPGGAYHGYNTTKDAFSGNAKMNLSQYRNKRSVEYNAVCQVIRPLAVYRIITTDVEKYITYHKLNASYSSVRPRETKVNYQYDFPMGYSVQFEKPNHYEEQVEYSFDIADSEGENEAIIASDYVLVNSNETYYAIDFEIRDADSRLINNAGDLQIPLKRNKITIIRDEFLTTDYSGGIGIDDGFDGFIDIEF